MKYLVTGGAGFIGSALVKRLLRAQHDVVVLDDLSRGSMSRIKDEDVHWGKLHLRQGDVRDPIKVRDAAWGCDAIVHMAYLQGTQNFYSKPTQVLDVAVNGMMNVLRTCTDQGIRKLMVVSSSEAYQVASIVPTPETIPLTVPDVLNPRYSYGGGKILWEIMTSAWASEDKLDQAIIVRPHNIIGPDMGREHVIPQFCLRMNDLIRKYPAGTIPFPILGSGKETRSFCYVDDCSWQMRTILDDAPEGVSIWNVGVMDERTVEEVAHAVATCYDRNIIIQPGKLAPGSPDRRLPDTAKVEKLLEDHAVRTTFGEAIASTVAWYKALGDE